MKAGTILLLTEAATSKTMARHVEDIPPGECELNYGGAGWHPPLTPLQP